MKKIYPLKKRDFFLFLVPMIMYLLPCKAQQVLHGDQGGEPISIYRQATILNTGKAELSIADILERESSLTFIPLVEENSNLGFTEDNYWIKFILSNPTNKSLLFFLETGRPITDRVDLYAVNSDGTIVTQQNGDMIPFRNRSFPHRKIIFPVKLEAEEQVTYYANYKSDGEVINVPLKLHTVQSFFKATYLDQLVYGIFYGILILAAVIYLFFYIGLHEKSFAYYFIYIASIFSLHFALDGFFFQYLDPESGWLAKNAILLTASISAAALGKYTQVYLQIKKYNHMIDWGFRITISALLLLIFLILFVPYFWPYYYPLVNLLGILITILCIVSVVYRYIINQPTDPFFALGIFFLTLGFIVFILNNFSLIPNSFLTENSSKLGTGIEIIFLSLAMSNKIRWLKTEKEKMQTLALQKAEESNEIKSYFMSNMSHELRTPLNAILGISKVIQEESNEKRIIDNCEVIQYSSKGLLNMIDDILDYSKIEKKELRLEPAQLNFDAFIKEVNNVNKNQAESKGLEYIYVQEGDLPEFILSDERRLWQIFNHILGNALKFTSSGSVALKIKSTPLGREKAELKIIISDTGIGISTEKLDQVFGSFIQQESSDKRKFGGIGLGLCIVKELVKLHGGSIHLDSIPGKGTTCEIILPVTIPDSPPTLSSSEANVDYDLYGNRILVVEDNPINRLVIKKISKKWKNTSISYAENGSEALSLLRSEKFDIILMDLQMPEMDGYEATIEIRKGNLGPLVKTIPIIAVTADTTDQTKVRVSEIGMNDYMSKPVDAELLFAKIKSCLIHGTLV